jgi:hypothetical protein
MQAKSIDSVLFSADGDFIHDFLDCIYLGPYTRVDWRACDADGILDCPFYARDEDGGVSRNFTACFGDIMHGDHRLPYTCGSPLRRSIIKYFFRNYFALFGASSSSSSQPSLSLNTNVSKLIMATVQSIYTNYTAATSRGCLDPKTGRCSLGACNIKTNGFAPCMDTSFQISSQNLADFIINVLLGLLPSYYEFTQTSTLPLTTYYNVSGATTPVPAQWGANPTTAAVAASLSHFSPAVPVIAAYSAQVQTLSLSLSLILCFMMYHRLWFKL